jgi:superfamily II DNA/RNA helicase
MPPEIRRLADAFLMNPKEISVAPPASPAETVAQHLLVVDPVDKRETLRRLIRQEDVKNALIFCNRKRDVDILNRSLVKHGLDSAALHGDMPQSKRTETLERFKNGDVRILVASDVAARGLDVQGLSHVFNFDVPHHAEDYVHRIGRTGRAGRDGRAFTLATPEDGKAVAAIEALIRKAIPREKMGDMPAQELSLEADDGRRRGGRGGRGRDGGRESRGGGEREPRGPRSERPREQAPRREEHRREEHRAKPEAREPAAPRLAASRPVRPEDGVHDSTTVMPIPMAHDREGARPHRERDHDNGPDQRVVGFGDHLPAFLRRPIRVAGA